MAAPRLPDPVKLLVAVLWAEPQALQESLARMTALWGSVDFAGADMPFDASDYYRKEMGPALFRRLLAFSKLARPEMLSAAKLACNQIEDELAVNGRRTVNLDVGYLDHNKIVLASAKNAGQKIHLGGGIYADLIARYKEGRYQPFEWTFPDFRDGRYDGQLAEIRGIYLGQLRQLRLAIPCNLSG